MQIFPEFAISLWDKWELRGLVLLSLLWQVILIILGNRRKYSTSSFLGFTVWVMYLSADWLATVSLGNLANNQGDEESKTTSKSHVLQALWAPFLLLHLGGPDTITAYALEDNSLWLRHLLGLLIQVIVALYVFLLSWGNDALTFIAIPVFLSGIIKYSERTCALRAASPDKLGDVGFSWDNPADLEHYIRGDANLVCLHKGYLLFPMLKRFYANLSLLYGEKFVSLVTMHVAEEGPGHETEIDRDAFKVAEVQLGFLFDVLYTKAVVIYTRGGLILRLISSLSIVAALVAFTRVIDDTNSRLDVAITFILFVGAVSLEIYAFLSLILSDWAMIWLIKRKTRLARFVYSSVSYILGHKKRWSGQIGQINLVNVCLLETHLLDRIYFFLRGPNWLDKIYFQLSLLLKRGQENVDDDLKSLILEKLQKTFREFSRRVPVGDATHAPTIPKAALDVILSRRGYNNLVRGYDVMTRFIGEFHFNGSILIWHIATDMCYYSEDMGHDKIANEAKKKCEASKKISEYLLYILLRRPLMLPKWIDMMTYVQTTFNEIIGLRHKRNSAILNRANASQIMLMERSKFEPPSISSEYIILQHRSILHVASLLAEELLHKHRGKVDELWEIICEVWIEMLTYAASHCEWGSHAQHLGNGGEFLTHVSVVMTDLGFSEHFDDGDNFLGAGATLHFG